MPLKRGIFLTFGAAILIFAQSASRKELTPRELFYAAAQAPAKPNAARPPVKTATRTPKAPAKPVEIARADPQPPAPRPSQSESSAPVIRTAVQTAPMP